MNDYLFMIMSNVLNSVQQKLYFKLKQIHRHQYNWLSFETIQMFHGSSATLRLSLSSKGKTSWVVLLRNN